VARGLVDVADPPELAVLDLRRARLVDPSVVPLFADLVQGFASRDGRVGISGTRQHEGFVSLLEAALDDAGETALVTFSELDLALEWCETALLAKAGQELDPPRIRLRDHELLHGVSDAEAVRLRRILRRRRIGEGSLVIRKGDPAQEMFLLVRGHLSVTTDVPGGERRRLATLSAGMVFGELAILSREPRTADVRADTAVDCYVLPADELVRLGETDPALKSILLENLLRIVSRLARRMSDELVVLAG
jgi:glutaminase